MAQDTWWGSDPVVGQAPKPASAPKPLRGPAPPADKLADEQRKQAAEQRAQEDQQFQRDKFKMEQERADRLEKKEAGGTVDEKKVATLTTRLVGAFSDINAVRAEDPSAQEPGLIETFRGGLDPQGFLGPAVRWQAGPKRRVVHDAQRDALDALLTLGTGAAYNKEQLDGQMVSYFPQYGDTPEEVDIKNRRLERLIAAAKANAGPAWERVEPQIEPFLTSLGTTDAGNDRPPPGGDGGDQTRVATGDRRFVEDKEFNDTIYSMWKSGKSWPELQAYAQTRGYRLDPPNAEALKYYGERGQSPFAPAGRYEELSTRQQLASTPVAGYASGATNALTFGLSDELYGAGSAAMGGDYEQARDEFQGAKRAIADMNPISDVVGNITGGALLPAGAGGMLGRTAAGGVISNAIRANPIKAGAAYGAAYGAGESNENRLAGAALGGAAGGAGGVLGKYVIEPGITRAVNSRIGQATLETLGDGVNAIRARRGVAPEGFDPDLVAAGERQGIPIRRPDAIPSLRNDMAAAEASPYGGGLVQNALRNDTDAVQARLAEIGGPGTSMVGDSVNYEMGQQGRKIAKGYIERTRVQKNDLYGEAEQLAGGQRITPDNAIAAVDRNIAELEAAGANTNAAQIGYLKGLREDLQKADGFSISEFQRLRSNAKGKIKGDNALTSSDADRRLDDVVKAFTGDAEAQLPQGAAAKLAEADEFYAKRQKFIEGTLQKLIGTRKNPASAEDVGKRLMDMSRSKADRDRLAGVLREASPEQRDDFSATIAETLGLGRNGEFSLGALATNIEKMPRNLRQLVFGDEGARALDDLQAIARAKSDTKGGLNSSRTGVVAMRDTLKRLMLGMAGGGAVGGASGDVTTAVVGGVAVPAVTELVASIGQRRAAKLLLNPDFTKWMRQAPKAATPKQAAAYIENLRERLGANPETAAIVNNVVPLFEQRVLGSVSQSATAAAAKEEEQNGRREPVGR